MEKITYIRMFDPNTKTSPRATGTEKKERNLRGIFTDRFKSFLDNKLEMEFTLPSTIDDEAIECSIELAEEMNIFFEKGGRYNNFSVRFFKPKIGYEQ